MKKLIASRAAAFSFPTSSHPFAMPTYVYETIPQTADEQPTRFEMKQSMRDAALTTHPESGKPVRRVVIGGTGMMGGTTTSSSGGGPCGSACGCHPH